MKIKLLLVLISMLYLSACGDSSDQASLLLGEEIVKKNCKVCHAQGINGAPIIGNKKMWGKRTHKSLDELVANASQGYGLMPAKGGNDALTTDEIKTAITYMLAQLEN